VGQNIRLRNPAEAQTEAKLMADIKLDKNLDTAQNQPEKLGPKGRDAGDKSTDSPCFFETKGSSVSKVARGGAPREQ
jgi:hypothetical protein